MAWNIGANDVANAFGTSVGSGAVTFRRALILAAIFEFCGAFFVGAHVTGTIRGEILRPEAFALNPGEFAIGMLASILAASLWLHVATFYGQPVSTTHAIIGAVIGFGVVAHGPACVQWLKMGRIAASWFVSPVVGGVLAYLIYQAIRRWVLNSRTPLMHARVAIPVGFGAVICILGFSIVGDLLPGLHINLSEIIPLALIAGLVSGWGCYRFLKVRIQPVDNAGDEYACIERWFGRLQILTACYMSFAHGANDVANAIAPVVGILQAIQGAVVSTSKVPAWLLAFGGVGIIAGLATYGYKVIEAVGRKITEVTPTRGFSAEFGTATTVLVCSLMGLPISTTFVLVGSVMGVGFARGFGAIDLAVVRKIFLSWVITIPIAAIGSAILFLILRWIVL